MQLSNFQPYLQYIPVFLIAFLAAVSITPWIGYIARKNNIVDLPGNLRKKDDKTRLRRIHTEPKLKLGGIAVIIPFLIITLIYTQHTNKALWGLLIGILLLLICGVIDDIYDLSAKIQALFQVLAGFVVILSGLQIETIKNPIGGTISLMFYEINIHGVIRYLPAIFLTIFWIVFIINAVKWVAGSDGLVEGNTAITALIIGLLSVRFQTHDTAIMGFALAGGLFGFLIFNFYPAKIFSGSAGKSVYGFILAVLAIYSGGKLATFLLTLSLPILDAIWVIGYRMIVNKPKNILQLISINDRVHIHHKLLDLGLTQPQVAISEYIFTLFMGCLAFLLTGLHKALAIGAAALFLLGIYIFIAYLLKKRRNTQ